MLKILTSRGSARSELGANSPKTHAFFAHTLPLKKPSFPEVSVCAGVICRRNARALGAKHFGVQEANASESE